MTQDEQRQTLELEYACTNAEVEKARALSQGKTPARRMLDVLFNVAIVGLAFWVIVFRQTRPVERPYFMAVFITATIGVLAWKQWQRKHSDAKLPSKIVIDREGIRMSDGNDNVMRPWSSFSKAFESPELFALLDRTKSSLVVIPKRAFPDASWQDWFRAQTQRVSEKASSAPGVQAAVISAQSDDVNLRVQLGFRDYLDRALRTWKLRGILLLLALILGGTDVYAALHPAPTTVNSLGKVVFVYELPFFMVISLLLILMGTFVPWISRLRKPVTEELVLSADGIQVTSTNGFATIKWATDLRYQETCWSFILWRGPVWMLLPKRAFASSDDLARARDLIARHLAKSNWFWG